MATLPVFDSATPKVSILAIGQNTRDSANELLVAAGQRAAEFQPQASLKADFMLNAWKAQKASSLDDANVVSSCPRAQRVPTCARRCTHTFYTLQPSYRRMSTRFAGPGGAQGRRLTAELQQYHERNAGPG